MIRHNSLLSLFMVLSCMVSAAYADQLAPEHINGAKTIDTVTAKSFFDHCIPFIDVRGLNNFNAGHIPDAYHLPVKSDFTEQNLHAVAKQNEPVVIYCNGINCMGSSVAAQKAVEWGWTKVYYYREGMPAWKQHNHPIEIISP